MLFRQIDRSRFSPVGLVTLAAAVSLVASPVATQSQPDRQVRPNTYRVASFDDLKPETDDEIALAKFFKGKGNTKLAEMNEVNLRAAAQYLPIPPRSNSRPNESAAERHFRASICSAEAVFVGRVAGSQARLVEGETWLFTTYTVIPVSMIRPSGLASEVSVSIPSGAVNLAGKIVTTVTLPLLRYGSHYLFLANRIPRSSAYTTGARADEVSWPANTGLLTHLNRMAQLDKECQKEPR